MAKISVHNVRRKYGNREVISGLSFDIQENEFVALIGPSGSGKSTVLNMVGLLETIDGGQIYIKGQPLPKVNSKKAAIYRRTLINYLFQSNALISNATVYDNLMLAMHYSDLNRKEKEIKINEYVQLVKLENVLHQKINELSGGEQQRVAIVRVLLKPGEIILADEPTGSLDPEMAQNSFELLRTLRDQYGKTILLVTHNMDQAEQCDRIIRLRD